MRRAQVTRSERAVRRAWQGLVGEIGPGASAAVLTAATAAGLATGIPTARRRGLGVAAVIGLTAVDIVGGMVAFQLPGTRRRYQSTSVWQRMGLAVGHVQVFALPLAGEGTWRRAAGRWAVVVGGTALLQRVPEPARRPAGVVLGSALAVADAVTDASAQRWLGPVWHLKLVTGHATLPDPR